MRLSIIVPVLNEAATLRRFLQHVREFAPTTEIIVVDGDSDDGSFEVARGFADQVAQSPRGRARQMNVGAALARSDVLWFVHADSEIARASVRAIEEALATPKIVGGCFRLQIASARWIYRIRDGIGNFLVDLFGIAFGDRGFFCRREAFLQVGGYPEIPILDSTIAPSIFGTAHVAEDFPRAHEEASHGYHTRSRAPRIAQRRPNGGAFVD